MIGRKATTAAVFALAAFLLFAGHDVRAEASDSDCMDCHGDTELTDDSGRSLYVAPDSILQSVHEGYACVDCHTGAQELPHEEKLPRVACKACHEETQDAYDTGIHGMAAQRGNADAPGCADCHGTHRIPGSADPNSGVHHRNLVETCARCHADPKVVQRHPFTVSAPVAAYRQSAHYRVLQGKDEARAPNCVDCHKSHRLKPARDPRSSIYWQNVPQTCGQCHADILKVYQGSVHGQAAAMGAREAPVCTDCHGEHEIRGPKDPKSPVYPAHVSKTTCVWCHESVRVVQKYGLEGRRLSTYMDSYHGLARQGGSMVAANCASCHGIHNIRRSSDAHSTIYPDNLPETCGKCHPGVGQNVSLGEIHVDSAREEGNAVIYYVRQVYLWMILATVGGMALHNGLDFRKKFGSDRLPYGTDYLRFTLTERVQHGTMAVSFIVLAYSGFALKFPDAWWAAPFSWTGNGEEGRRLIHRTAAVAMVAVCLFHLAYALVTRRGRQQLVAMLPRLKDVRDALHMVGYYLGMRNHHPAFARFSYIEKAEYWALVWGSVVMTVTGFLLWFADLSLRFVPKWALDVAAVIHYYEAWLAALAIVVWHFYWVIFNPKFYPMSLVWLTGGLSEEAMVEEHPLELEEIRRAQGQAEE